MQGEIKNSEGKIIGTVELPIEETLANLKAPSDPSAELAEKDSRIEELEGQVAELSSNEHNHEIVENALAQFKDNPGLYMEVGRQLGLDVQVVPAEVADEPTQELEFCQGKGDPNDGWHFHELFGMSSRVKPAAEEV